MKPLAGNLPYSIFCDSLEVYASDWTPDLLQEFRNVAAMTFVRYSLRSSPTSVRTPPASGTMERGVD